MGLAASIIRFVMYDSSGTLRYSPKVRDLPTGKWWCVLDCDEEIGRYYRSLFNWENRAKIKIMAPAWGSHISIIANEPPSNTDLWLADSGKQFKFSYDPALKSNGEYYWLDVFCEQMLELRERLGLKKEPFYPLHLTVGRIP